MQHWVQEPHLVIRMGDQQPAFDHLTQQSVGRRCLACLRSSDPDRLGVAEGRVFLHAGRRNRLSAFDWLIFYDVVLFYPGTCLAGIEYRLQGEHHLHSQQLQRRDRRATGSQAPDVSRNRIQDTRPKAVACIRAPDFEGQLKGSETGIINGQPGIEQDGVHLFGSRLIRDFQVCCA